ncbi:MAG TPA: MFS transporter [Rhodospirillales bacterium]|nr:MFS transporter [Rhodospirillales bacterium]
MRVSEPVLPQLAELFAVPPGRASVVFSAYALAYGLAQILWGPVGDRMGKLATITVLTLASAVTTALVALAPGLQLLALGRFVSGLTVAGIIPLAMAWIGETVPYDRRQPVLARYLTGQILGVVGGQAAGGIVGGMFGWRAAFLLLALVFLLAGLALLPEFRRHDVRPGRGVRTRATGGFYLSLLGRPWVRVVLLVVALEGAVFFGAFAYVGAYLRTVHGLDYGLVGSLIALFGAGGLLFVAGVGRLVARLGERGLAAAGGLVAASAFALLPAASGVLLPGLAMFLLGVGFYMLHNTLQTNATQMAPEMRGVAVSAFASSFFLSQALGTWLGGRLVDLVGYTPLFLLAALAMPLLGLLFARRLARRGS